MDAILAAAARALAGADVVRALKLVGVRDDAPALALRGIAMAQLGEYPRARALLRRAARGFGAHEVRARARCVVAEAEVALAMRDLGGVPRGLSAAWAALEARDDRANAAQARLVAARRLLLLGRLDDAADALRGVDPAGLPPAVVAVAALASAELALRALQVEAARSAFARAEEAARCARIPALAAEIANAQAALHRPAARRLRAGSEQTLRLDEVTALRAAHVLLVDECRREVAMGGECRPLVRRPVLFALVRALAGSWPGDADRRALMAHAFNVRRPDETHRARLRVEIGRLRAILRPFARIEATARGFALRPDGTREVVVLAPPIDGDQASLVALLADGAPWSTSALALALRTSQRTVQRALVALEHAGRVRSIGRARARRWLAPPLTGFATILLLPAAPPIQ